ncbi:LytR/AlgR family response regulator transcription factor [Alteromonas oceanisediminis]|uniref:LytR/AlgR family response regulator transcription factor n=1 Tax=Alteromonas oceanisediminis TaxID=2836180 RepID=UPI001BDA1729|nr:LytTR family DNA-binding domain-containing protein [Alteromonas oceanisediminis]MBT0587190.1 LytTR family DNA-binding domain-containing protein [Alteromonas oceanisediminis]
MTEQSIRVLIVDDESLARQGLRLRLQNHADVDVIGECPNGLDAVAKIPELRPDVVFLDIQMPELNGFQVIQKLREADYPLPLFIFVTAYDTYAIKAFDIHALDYVLKPIDDVRLEQALQRVRATLSQHQSESTTNKLANLVADLTGDDCEDILRKLAAGEPVAASPYPDVLSIKDGSEVSRVPVVDIQWVDAAGDYMCVHAKEGMHIMRKTMKELEQSLDPKTFIRVHRSALVNINFVKKLVSHVSGEYHLILHNATELKVSRSHRDRVKAAMDL